MSEENIYLARHLKILSRILMDGSQDVCKTLDATLKPDQVSLILAMQEKGFVTVMEAAKQLQVSHVHVQKILRTMVRDGVAETSTDPEDARRTLYTLTPRGAALLPVIRDLNSAADKAIRELVTETGVNLPEVLKTYQKALSDKGWGTRLSHNLNHDIKEDV